MPVPPCEELPPFAPLAGDASRLGVEILSSALDTVASGDALDALEDFRWLVCPARGGVWAAVVCDLEPEGLKQGALHAARRRGIRAKTLAEAEGGLVQELRDRFNRWRELERSGARHRRGDWPRRARRALAERRYYTERSLS